MATWRVSQWRQHHQCQTVCDLTKCRTLMLRTISTNRNFLSRCRRVLSPWRVFWSFGPCVFCRDPGDCLFLVFSVAIPSIVFPSCLCGLAALVSRKVFWLVMGLSDTEEEVLGVGPGQGRMNSGRSNHNRWQEGVDVQILFSVECVDEVALQAMLQ